MNTARKITAGLVLALAVAAGIGVARAWAPDLPLRALTPRWAPPPSTFVALQGMQVHLRDEGPRDDPQPIVLLHGTSASLHTWDGWAAALSPQRRVIRMDMPGFGLTGPAPDANYHLDRYAAFVIAVMDHLGVRQAVLAGNSLGGEVAWKTAVDFPGRVSRLVLVDAAGYPYVPQSVPLGFRLAQIPALQPITARLLPRSLIEASVRNVYGDASKVTPDLVDRYEALTRRAGNRQALNQRFAQHRSGDHEADIARLRLPTLIVWGGRDRLIPPEAAQRFLHDIPGSRLSLFEDLGHVPQEEDPARTVAVVQRFVAP